jgi:hypothetical protein
MADYCANVRVDSEEFRPVFEELLDVARAAFE